MDMTRRSLLLAPAASWAMRTSLAFSDEAPARKPSRRRDAWMPKLSENLHNVELATLRWLKQIGCRHVIFQGTDRVDADKKGFWTVADVARAQSCGVQTVANRTSGKTGPVFDSAQALLFDGSDELAVHNQTSGRISMKCVDT